MVQTETFDILVIGGGINGVGIARDAAGRGCSIMLCEEADLAGATSSASSKLIHGGLRYLEQYAFRFVRQALIEREILMNMAPHLVRPMRFVLPVEPALRPPWLVAAGLFLYDRLARQRLLPRSTRLDLRKCPEGAPLASRVSTGFAYFDCFVDDARLVIANAIDARERGAQIRTRMRCRSLNRGREVWSAELVDRRDGSRHEISARIIVNTAGPWVSTIEALAGSGHRGESLRLVKGSHVLLPRLYAGDHAYTLQNDDRRVVFVIPYEQRFSLVGPTEMDFTGNPREARITDDEAAYLCRAVSRSFAKSVAPSDVLHTYAGVRPLYDDATASATAVSREFVLGLDAPAGAAPILNVYGGKITTYRRLAEAAMERIAPVLKTSPRASRAGSWTARTKLPGGDIPDADFSGFARELQAHYPSFPGDVLHRLARAYGTRTRNLLAGARGLADLGTDFGAGLTEAEIDFLVREEWAMTGEDILWRRSKLGLHLSAEAQARVTDHVRRRVGSAPGDDAHD
jgi:glycerol-3-phosphate dehydrogenase